MSSRTRMQLRSAEQPGAPVPQTPMESLRTPPARVALLLALIAVNVAFLPLLARIEGNSAGDRDARIGFDGIVAGQGDWWEPSLTLGEVAPDASYLIHEWGSLERFLVAPILLTVGRAREVAYTLEGPDWQVPSGASRTIEVPCRLGRCVLFLGEDRPERILVRRDREGTVFVDATLVRSAP